MAHLLQDNEGEFIPFCQLMKNENVRSYLEIGSFSGGSIETAAQYLTVGSRIVSIDKPWKQTKQERLTSILNALKQRGYDTHLVVGDSTESRSIYKARKFGPYDAVFIDGNHTFPYVKSDWENYGSLGRIVGFHDIAKDKPPHGASAFWNQLKSKYRHVEFISEATRARTDGAFGIGVLWRV
jgi:predicted O-methyltransferase YrrM